MKLEVLGQYLDGASAVLFLDDSTRARLLEADPSRIGVEIEIAADAAYGAHYFRSVSARGASNILLFRVGDQPHLLDREPNSTLDTAQEVSIPVTINGRLEAESDYDFFRFRAEAGQTWVFDLRAARQGNSLDAALILLDGGGRRLEFSEEHFIWDPFFVHKFETTGEYTVVVQPLRSDPNYAYQLDIRQSPHLETIAPISLKPGGETEVTLFGAAILDRGSRIEFSEPGFSGQLREVRGTTATALIRVPAGASPGARQLVLTGGHGRSNPLTLLVDPIDAHAGGENIRPPVSITGIARYRQPERFVFEAAAGQSLAFEVRAQRFGSPADLVLRLLDEKGKPIKTNDDASFAGVAFNKDPRLVHKFEERGRYRIEIRNLWSVTGENFPYQLRIGPPEPGYELMLATDQPYLYPGETGKLKVTVERQDGFDGEIQLEIRGLPDGVTAKPAVVAAGSNDAEIILDPGPARQGAHGQIRVMSVGRAAWRSVRISSGGGEGATFARVDQATLVVAEKPRFSFEPEATSISIVRGSTTELLLAIRRAKGFEGEIQLAAEYLPAGVRLEPATAGAGDTSVTIRFSADPNAAAGRSPRVLLRGRDAEGHRQDAPRISVTVY